MKSLETESKIFCHNASTQLLCPGFLFVFQDSFPHTSKSHRNTGELVFKDELKYAFSVQRVVPYSTGLMI